MAQTDREIAEMIAKFRTPPGMSWVDLANDIETVLKGRPRPPDGVETKGPKEMTDSIFGYYESADQTKPTFDPGLDALCPHCLKKLEVPVRTMSLMLPGDNRSFFYRTHRECDARASPEQVEEIESSLIDSRAAP